LPVLAQTPAPSTPSTAVIKRTADGKPDFSGAWTFRLAAPPRVDSRGICAGPRCGGRAPAGGPNAAASNAEAAGLDPSAAAGPRAQFPKYKPEFA
jgi:hypothetical protein